MWAPEFARVPRVDFLDPETVRIEDVRDFVWTSEGNKPGWITRTISPDDLTKVHVVTEQFRSWGATHAFICFETSLDPICLSIEARLRAGESFSAFRGLFGSYELMYSYVTVRDGVGKRLVRGRDLDVCALSVDAQERWRIFAALARSARENAQEPARYHTLRRNCITELLRHILTKRAPLLSMRHPGAYLVEQGVAEPCDIYDAQHPPPFFRNA